MERTTIQEARYRVDAYSASEPHESNRWASTDRGWVYDLEHPDRDHYDGNAPVGNYLDYGPCGEHHRANPEGAIHAVRTRWSVDLVTRCRVYRRGEARHFGTVEEAIAWIMEEAH